MRHLTIIGAVLILLLVLFLVACQTSQIVATLEGVVSAAEIAIPVIGAATGLNPATSTAIVSYLQQVNTATAQAASILAATGLTSMEKSAQIVQLFGNIALGCNCVPPGTPQEIVTVVNAVAQAVSQFLTNFPAQSALKTAALAKPVTIKISASDQTKLTGILNRAEANLAKLKGVKQ